MSDENTGDTDTTHGDATTDDGSTHDPQDGSSHGVIVVGVGGSAGSLGSFQQLLRGLPADSGMAFVFVLHLPPDGDDQLAGILARETAMPVTVVEDGTEIEANHVYVADPSKEVEVVDGRFGLRPLEHIEGVRASIDVLFRSLARVRERLAIGVLCSGMGSDGTQGLREIRAAGGLSIAQSPETCEHETMPRTAIRAGVVDAVLSIEEMPAALVGFSRHPYARGGVRGDRRDPETDLRTLVRVLRTRTGNDFSGYKPGTLLRRMERRMGLHDLDDFDEYVIRLRADDTEVQALCEDLRIRVTNFFRDPKAYEVLRDEVVPEIVRSAEERGGAIRAWIPACATGEEAYSLVILFREALRNVEDPIEVKVFASDVDDRAIEIARSARYPKSIAVDVPGPLLKRYFTEREDVYEVKKPVRESVVFATQDVLVDPPFSRLDLVSCRNLLIYLQPEMQARLLGLLRFGLRDGGYLWLGTAETVGQQADLFETVSREQRVYRRTGGSRPDRVEFPAKTWDPRSTRAAETVTESLRGVAGWARRMIEDRFVPACVVIDRQLQILYFSGETHDYLVQPMGEPTQDLREMAREGLSGALNATTRAALDTGSAASEATRIRRGNGYFPITVGVVPLKAPHDTEGLLLVTFQDVPEVPDPDERDGEPGDPADNATRQLQYELESVRQELQSTLEQLESSAEEYKAAHEEVRSMNEELQSVNEELKTSKEELQSVNEELSSVNQQLQSKVDQLEDVNNDLGNLLRSTDVATLFLDRDLCIQRFTPATRRVFKVLPGDIGRPLSDLSQPFTDGELTAEVERVLDDLVPVDREVEGDGEWFLRRVLPYRTEDDRIDGVVVTFTRITEQKRAEERLREANEHLEQRVAERNWCLLLLQRVTVVANEASTIEAAVGRTLAGVGEHLGWPLGHAYLRRGEVYGDSGLWWAEADGEPPEQLVEAAERLTFRSGEGYLGQVVEERRPLLWSPIGESQRFRFRRNEAILANGFDHVFAFPIVVDGHVEGVLEFLGREPLPYTDSLEELAQLGSQLGAVVERQRAREALRAAVNETIHVEERERRDLAEALHDDLGQLLAVLRMRLEELHSAVDPSTRDRLEDAEAIVTQAAEATRSLTFQLSPPILYELGLTAALEWFADEMQRMYGVRVNVDGPEKGELIDDRTRFLLFRSARELLVNAGKHSDSDEVDVRLRIAETVHMVIEDGGLGFDADDVLYNARGGFGLFSIRERVEHLGGTMRIESRQGEGTKVEIELPLPDHERTPGDEEATE